MKNLLKVLVFGLLVAFIFSSCSKRPDIELKAAEDSVNSIVKAGADIYAKDELKRLKEDLAIAMEEVNTQSKKFFKKYGNAKEMLVKVQADTNSLLPVIQARKEEAKNNAIKLHDEAKLAVENALALLVKAPRGKGTRADINAFQADLKGLEGILAEVQNAINSEDYIGAADKAKAIKDKAAGISDQINKAMEKVKRR